MKRKYIYILSIFILVAFGCVLLSSEKTLTAPAKKKAFIISHFHHDPVWTNTQAGETLRSFAAIKQQFEYAEIEPRFKFEQSEVDYLKPYWDAYPLERENILKLVREGRLEFTGGYNEPEESEVGGEAMIRNFAFGKIFKESLYGAKVKTVTQYDVYGHSVQLPRILLGTGYDYAVFQRGNIVDMPSEFNWLGADGSKIFTKRINYPGMASDAAFNAGDPKSYGLTNNAMFMSGDDFREPDRSIGQIIKKTKNFDLVSGTNNEFFEAVQASLKESGKVVPEISRDQSLVFEGCYGSRIDTKFANRIVENLLPDAEKFSTIYSAKFGAPYPWFEMDRAWRLLFFGEHHDALPGTDTENVNLDLLTGWREAAEIGRKYLDQATAGIAEHIDTASKAPKNDISIPIVIFNSLNWSRTEAMEVNVSFAKTVKVFNVVDSDGKPVAFQLKPQEVKSEYSEANIILDAKDIPSLGYRVFYVVGADKFPDGAIPTKAAGPQTVMENDLYRITVDPARGGDISSLFAKKLNKEFIDTTAGLGNEILALEEGKNSYADVLDITGKFWRSGDYPAESVEVEHGAVFDRMIVKTPRFVAGPEKRYTDTKHPAEEEVFPAIVKEIIIYKDNPRIDFRTHFNGYKGTDMLFKAAFPANLKNVAPVFEDRFAAVTKETNTVDFLKNKGTGAALKREYAVNNWVGLSPAAALVFYGAMKSMSTSMRFICGGVDSTHAVAQYPMVAGEIVVHRGDNAALESANKLAENLIDSGITSTITYDDKTRTNEFYGFRISIGYAMNNAYSAKLINGMDGKNRTNFDRMMLEYGHGIAFAEPLDSMNTATETHVIPILIIESNNGTNLNHSISSITENLNNFHIGSLYENMNNTQFKSMMDNYGMALINNGNPGASVELPNTLTMTLTRSSTGWPAGAGFSDDWQRANYNHMFRYALMPHTGDWDKAGVANQGYEFNFPLIGVQTMSHGGSLPGDSQSFINTGDTGFILTALKPVGNPAADGFGTFSGSKDVAVRFYNPRIRATEGEIKLDFPILKSREANFLDIDMKKSPYRNSLHHAEFQPHDIRAFIVSLDTSEFLFKPEKEAWISSKISPPQNARYWETNENAAPQGFMPIAVTIEPVGYSEDRKTLNVRAVVAGNLKDVGMKGNLVFKLPDGASVVGGTDYDLKPMGVKSFELGITGLDFKKLTKHFISSQVGFNGETYEDVLTFNNWKVFHGDVENGAAPELDDSAWETLPLARFWSAADSRAGVTWYRRKMFIPGNMSDLQMLFERPRDAEIEVYINGTLVRHEKWGMSYKPQIEKKQVNYNQENLIAIKYIRKEDTPAPAWCVAFHGAEGMFNKTGWKYTPESLTLAPGEKSSFTVEFENPFEQDIEGEAVLASPIQTWAEGGAYSLIQITPSKRTFAIKAGGRATMTFDVSVPADAQPGNHVAAVKLIYKGMLTYTDTMRIEIKK